MHNDHTHEDVTSGNAHSGPALAIVGPPKAEIESANAELYDPLESQTTNADGQFARDSPPSPRPGIASVALVAHKGETRIDSRLLAKGLQNKHKSVLEIIDR